MADPARYRYMDTAGRRSPPLYNPARSSLPVTTTGYGSLYSGDLHAMSASHHEGMSRPADEYRTSAVPVSATTYAVRKEPLSRSTSVNDGTRAHRIVDSHSHTKRPIIVTTKHPPSAARAGSPSRDSYRSSEEGPYYTEPASSIPRTRPAALDDDEFRRLRDRTHHDRLGSRAADTYRPRPGSLYAGPNHRSSAFEFSDEGYEYTKPSDLARYDLDHDRRPRTRRQSIDRYYRPTVSISTDLARPFEQSERRARGPPPTTRGLDKVAWSTAGGIYDGAGARMPLPSSGPLAPDVRRPGPVEPPGSPRGEPRGGPRPLSMIQDDPTRHSHYVDPYHDDDPYYRDAHDRDPEYFQDDRVASRGFGILVDPNDYDEHRKAPEKVYRDERRDRRDQKRYEVREPRRRSDDDLEIVRHEHDDRDRRRHRERDYAVEEEAGRDRRERRADDAAPDSKGDKIRDKVTAGLGLAAASIGLGSAARKRDDRGYDDASPSRRHRDDEPDARRHEDADRAKPSRKEAMLGDEEFELVEHPRDGDKVRDEKARDERDAAPDARDAKENGHAVSSQDDPPSDGGKTKPRRRLRASSFNPNDTAALAEMKARLNEIQAKAGARQPDEPAAQDKGRPAGRDASPARERSVERRSSPDGRSADPDAAAADDGKSRELVAPSRDERQVRVVAPPRDAPAEKKPIKGILKQPRAQFPEEPNPVREGVAPHKDDRSKADVPPGARWTKISRKMVNPEALRIGKERFEVRDDFVIVLRVLSKEEIQAYAAATAALRERRKREVEREMRVAGADGEYDEDRDRDRDRDDEDRKHQRHHRQHRRGRDEDERDRRDRGRDREREELERERHRRHL